MRQVYVVLTYIVQFLLMLNFMLAIVVDSYGSTAPVSCASWMCPVALMLVCSARRVLRAREGEN